MYIYIPEALPFPESPAMYRMHWMHLLLLSVCVAKLLRSVKTQRKMLLLHLI